MSTGGNPLSTDDRIIGKLVDLVEADPAIPKEVSASMRSLWERGLLSDSDAIFKAVTAGVKDHAENKTT